PRPTRPDEQRWPAGPRPTREQLGIPGDVIAAIEVDRAVTQERADDRERLLEAGDEMVERESQGEVLRLVPPRPETEDETSAADLVDGRGHPRQDDRRMEADRRDERPDLDPIGDGRDRRELRPGFPGSPRAVAGP